MGFWKLIKVDLKIKYNTIFNSHSTLNKTDKITVFIFILLLIIFSVGKDSVSRRQYKISSLIFIAETVAIFLKGNPFF